MLGFITCALVGAVIIVIGIMNMRGNISTLHSYHRARVKDEDVKPFGKLVGLGTIIMGVACVLIGASIWTSELSGNAIYATVGVGISIAAMAVGAVITFYAMKKYNGGIF